LLVLGLWAIGSTIAARLRRRPESGAQLAWLVVLAAQVLLFCWFITWQNWHVRMHLPVTIAVAVLVAVRLADRATERARDRALVVVCALAVAVAPIYALFNVTRPLVGHDSILTHSRAAVRYEPRPQLRAPYGEAVNRAVDSGAKPVGLVTGIDDWQYPIITALADEHVSVTQPLVAGPSARYSHIDPIDLDAVICVGCTVAQHEQLAAAGLESVALRAGGPRQGRGDDVTTVELWLRR
ncbi:MAG: hypothetical protein KDC46_07295, partial [Thermoleophilia bacterium]|nr:hypothetical protein [Thermoleophilia bacterium]